MQKTIRRLSAVAATAVFAVAPVIASAQTWASWNSSNASSVFGTVAGINVTYTGTFSNFDPSSNAFSYWIPSVAYSQNGVIAPDNAGLIRFTPAGTGSIIFQSAVVNPYIAFNSVGAPSVPVTYDFGSAAFTVVSDNDPPNCAYWGCGSYSTLANTLTGSEFSGVAQFHGTFTQIDFTYTAEGWHGITVGIDRVENVVPEPSTYALMAVGLLGAFAAAHRRRKV